MPTKGFETARQHFLTTMDEETAGVLNTAATPILGIDITTEGNGFDNPERFSEHTPDGFDSVVGVALVGIEGQISGNFMPHYLMLEHRFNALCGPAYFQDILPDGRTIMKWKLPEFGDRINRITNSGFFGLTDNAVELLYGKMQQLTVECSRSGNVGGNITLHFNRVRRAQAMFNIFTAQNAKFAIIGENVTGDVVVRVTPANGTAFNFTVSIDQSASTIKTNIQTAAIAAGNTGFVVSVTGTISQGTGETHRLYGPAVNGAATIYGGAVTVNPSTSTTTTVRNAIQALGGNYAARTVTGTITAPVGGSITGYTVAGATASNHANATGVVINGSYTATTLSSGTNGFKLGTASDNYYVIGYSNYTGSPMNSGDTVYIWFVTGGAFRAVYSAPYSSGTLPSSGWTGGLTNSGTTPPSSVSAINSGGTPGIVDIIIGVPASAGNVGDLDVTGTGYTATSTPPGANGGNISVEITTPAYSRFKFVKYSGVAGYSVKTVNGGSDGGGPDVLDGPYLEPTHVLCYKAASFSDLNSIKMGITQSEYSAGNPGPDLTDSHIIKTAQANSISFEGMVNPAWFEDRNDFAGGHVDGEKNVTASITLPKDKDGRCEEIYATEKGCTAVPWYLRQAYKCGFYEAWFDLYCVRNQKPNFPTENNIAQRQFPLRRQFNPSGSCILTLIKP